MKKALVIGIIGLITIAVTLCIFFLSEFEKTVVSGYALFFVLLAEISLFIGLEVISTLKSLSNKVFVTAGVSGTLCLYLFAVIIISIFSNAFKDNLNLFILIQIIIVALSAIVIVLISLISHHINTKDQKYINNKEFTQAENAKRGGF